MMNFSRVFGCASLVVLVALAPTLVFAAPDIRAQLDDQDVSWDMPGPTSREAMPLGNGDIGLNVWVEPNGDLDFLIGKTDAWSEDVKGSKGLMKLGGVHVALNPSPLVAGAPFLQRLKLHYGEIEIKEGTATLRVWVDANYPVIRVEAKSPQPVSVKVTLDDWRKTPQGNLSADVILPNQKDRVAWYHRDTKGDKEVANLTFGAVIQGKGLVSQDASTLESSAPVTSQLISVYPLTATTSTPEEWLAKLDKQVSQIDGLKLERTRKEHQEWWDAFWHRSWVFVQGDADADKVTQGYVLQRFVTACGGRGAYPIKFNGSIFVVDYQALKRGKDAPMAVDADFRDWGGQYWFQNTRPMYWPRLAAGDFDMMQPLFKMYATIVSNNAAQVQGYYHHAGAYFAETAPFWGSLGYWGPEVTEHWTGHYFTPVLELSMMMLDYYEFTGDKKFARETLVPMATAGLTFFDKHFGRDDQGKILLDPDNSIEMYWKVHDPAPDIAGLRAVLARMIALPEDLVNTPQREAWKKMLSEVPDLPIVKRNGKTILLPYTGEQTAKSKNGENPELYAIYPFRLFGLEKPDLKMAIDTFNARKCRQKGCWVQDPIQAAMLGLADVARDYVTFALTRKEPDLKFPAFWAHANDYQPDEDNGGNGEQGLQKMLMQTEGKKILLLPAWPEGWDADFKLNAPYRTTVQGRVEHGKLTNLVVTPAERKADVIDMSTRPDPFGTSSPSPNTNSVKNILSVQDSIVALKRTVKGGPNILAGVGDFGGVGGNDEQAIAVIDRNVNTKYFNAAQDGSNPRGINTGFVVTPVDATSVVTTIQFATANDMPQRDPLSLTIEGSNDPKASEAQGNGFTLIYEGPTGLEHDPGRNEWGSVINFKNTKSYKTYRVLITEVRSDGADSTQYSEVRMGPSGPP